MFRGASLETKVRPRKKIPEMDGATGLGSWVFLGGTELQALKIFIHPKKGGLKTTKPGSCLRRLQHALESRLHDFVGTVGKWIYSSSAMFRMDINAASQRVHWELLPKSQSLMFSWPSRPSLQPIVNTTHKL